VRLIAGRYRIEALLGQGGFGKVYRAFDQKLQRVVALKLLTIPEGGLDREEKILRFEEEVRAVARLDHSSIVPVYDAGLEDEAPWMAMRLVAGSSLESALHEGGPFPISRALPLLFQVASALSHAHRRGIVHRDVKPANILLEERDGGGEQAWLTDFGIAKLLAGLDLTLKGAVLGTPSYMSPEQATGRSVDSRSDLFALGCVAAELVTGRPAFQGSSVMELLHAIIHRPPDLEGLRERAGPAFEAVVLRCLAKSSEDRWQTADDLAQAMETLMAPAGEASNGKRTKWRLGLSRRRAEAPWDGACPLEVSALRKGFGFGKPVLAGFDLQVPRGSVYALMGRNGTGKTTLIRTCLGLYRRDAGRVAVFGRDPEWEGPAVLARVGLVPDALAVDEKMKVGELLKFVSRFYTQWDQAHCYRLLARYDLPLDQKIRDLSRGMKTKVSLVMALAHRPELLILDDPTLGLDAVILEEFVESLEEAAREGATILIASHNYGELERIATHAGLFKDGRLLLSDTIADLKSRTCEVRLTFRDDVPDFRAVPDFHLLRTSGRHVTGVILDHRDSSLDRLHKLAPQDLEVRELSLREIFVHFLR
jgi:ABC-type multidrug transport system ATPase subunit